MTENRRSFLYKAGMLTGAFSITSLFNQLYADDIEAANKKISSLTAEEAATDEDYWAVIQQAYN